MSKKYSAESAEKIVRRLDDARDMVADLVNTYREIAKLVEEDGQPDYEVDIYKDLAQTAYTALNMHTVNRLYVWEDYAVARKDSERFYGPKS